MSWIVVFSPEAFDRLDTIEQYIAEPTAECPEDAGNHPRRTNAIAGYGSMVAKKRPNSWRELAP